MVLLRDRKSRSGGFVEPCLPYRPGRLPRWVKVKNPAAPAVKREAEEDWR
jgi:hypothetical protein